MVIASFDGADRVTMPDACVRALTLPGTRAVATGNATGFCWAAAPTRDGDPGTLTCGGVTVAGDVRLDGRAQLRSALGGAPGFRADQAAVSDQRSHLALVHAAWMAWGLEAVARLRGEFSFVLWDASSGTMVAARDGMGVRPLYHATVPGGVCLSNTIDAVRRHPSVADGLDDDAIASFLQSGFNENPRSTSFAGVSRLAPGEMLVRSQAGRSANRVSHWRLPDPAPIAIGDDVELVARFRSVFDDAVCDRVTGDTAILLSGGLDSPSMAATARRVAPGAKLYAQTSRIPVVESHEEVQLATAVARRLEIPHEVREFAIDPRPGESPRTPEPYDDYELAADQEFYSSLAMHAPVLLIGEDGDALFTPPGLGAMLRQYPPWHVLLRAVGYTLRHGHHPYLGFWLRRRLRPWRTHGTERHPWIGRHADAEENLATTRNRARPEAARLLTSALWQRVHQGTDRAFTGAPLEVRWPFLDVRLIEFVFSIPPIPWCQRKQMLRRAFTSELPHAVIERPKTTIPGLFERTVAAWRDRTSGRLPPLHPHTLEYVDAVSLAEALSGGDSNAVLAGWRALTLDRWLRDQEEA